MGYLKNTVRLKNSPDAWKTSFAAILIAETLAMAGFALSMPVIPLFLQDDIGIADQRTLKLWVGVIQSAAAVTLAIFAPIWGHLADVYSRRMMLLRAMFGGAVIVSLMALVQSPWQLLALRAIQGCLTGTIAAATVLTAGIAPAAKIALALGLLQTGIATGNSIGPLIGGVVSDFLGHRLAFLSTGVVLALAGVIVLKWVEDDHHPRKKPGGVSTGHAPIRSKNDRTASPRPVTVAGRPPAKRARNSIFPDIKPILASPVLVIMMMVTFILHAANSIAAPMLPLFLKELALKSLPPAGGLAGSPQYIGSSTGIVLGVGAAAGAIAAAVVGKYSTKFGYWRTLIFCLTAGAILTVPQAFVANMTQLAIFRALSSFFVGGSMPVLNAIIATSTEKEHQGSVYGFNSSVSSAGGALGPMIGSAVAMVNYRAVFLATALFLGAAAWGTIRRRQKL
ncbi:MFS transporter [Spirochaetia bacterium]|nr:MFS transporter [Spirochaetia bacterium]